MMHSSITIDRVTDAVEREMFSLDNPGFCKSCGMEAEQCEPDARNYEYEYCGDKEVFGAAELLMEMV